MNRRGFLSLLAGAAAAPLVPVPELDLGRRIFLPPRGGWLGKFPITVSMCGADVRAGNTLLTVEMLVRESLRILHEQSEFVVPINRQYDDGYLRMRDARPGQTLNIKLPRRYA